MAASRILFLEIEGVLVHEISRRTDLLLLGPDPKRFDNGFKPSITALNRITETTNAQVIVTSHWSSMGVGVLEDRLKQWGMTGRMADIVPSGKTRAEQITKWFDLTKRPESFEGQFAPVSSFVILDTQPIEGYEENTVLVSAKTGGLLAPDADKAINILTSVKNTIDTKVKKSAELKP